MIAAFGKRISSLLLLLLFAQNAFTQDSLAFFKQKNWNLKALSISIQGGSLQPSIPKSSFFNSTYTPDAYSFEPNSSSFLDQPYAGSFVALQLKLRFTHNSSKQTDYHLGLSYMQSQHELAWYSITPTDSLFLDVASYKSLNQYFGLSSAWNYTFRRGKRIEFITGLHSTLLLGTASKAREALYNQNEKIAADSFVSQRSVFSHRSFGLLLGIYYGTRLKLTKNSSFIFQFENQRSRIKYDGSWFSPKASNLTFGLEIRFVS